jgi:hypothetical protein
VNIFNKPREELTPAQRRLKWVKFDRLPQHLQDVLGKKKPKKPEVKKPVEDDQPKPNPNIPKQDDTGDKVTVLNLKDDFLIDYTKPENIHNKLKEIKEEQLRGKKHAHHHVAILTFMLEKATEPRQKVEIYLNLLNAIFSSAKTATPSGFLTRDGWVGALNYVKDMLKILNEPLNKAALNKVPSGVEDYDSSTLDIEKSIIPSFISFL